MTSAELGHGHVWPCLAVFGYVWLCLAMFGLRMLRMQHAVVWWSDGPSLITGLGSWGFRDLHHTCTHCRDESNRGGCREDEGVGRVGGCSKEPCG